METFQMYTDLITEVSWEAIKQNEYERIMENHNFHDKRCTFAVKICSIYPETWVCQRLLLVQHLACFTCLKYLDFPSLPHTLQEPISCKANQFNGDVTNYLPLMRKYITTSFNKLGTRRMVFDRRAQLYTLHHSIKNNSFCRIVTCK